MSERTLAVILAAGGGSRWVAGGGSGHKLRAKLPDGPDGPSGPGGRTVIAQSVEAPRLARIPVVVITGAVLLEDVLPPDVVTLHNDQWHTGQASSVQVAIRYASDHGFDSILVGLGDQPWLPHEVWQTVALRLSTEGPPIVVPVCDGRRGQPVGLRSSVWNKLPTEGDEGARVLMRNSPELVEELSCFIPTTVFRDIDTPEDLQWN